MEQRAQQNLNSLEHINSLYFICCQEDASHC